MMYINMVLQVQKILTKCNQEGIRTNLKELLIKKEEFKEHTPIQKLPLDMLNLEISPSGK